MATKIIKTSLKGSALLENPLLNKSSAFPEDERKLFGLDGLLPFHISTIEEQLARTYENFSAKPNPIEKYIYLASLYDRNEVLFYRLVQSHIREMVPIIYTPTVGEACQRYSRLFRRTRGLYISYPHRERLTEILKEARQDVSVIVMTDGERILGLGNLGTGGMGIPIGKLSLYTLCAGIDPSRTLPVMLDIGTNNPELLKDPLYLGWRHERIQKDDYDRFMDEVVAGIKARWPTVLLQWEDFAKNNAWRFLHRYENKIASFNDDIQGTASVTVAGLGRACRIAGKPLSKQKIVISGAGSAATGLAELLKCEDRAAHLEGAAQHEIWLVDTKGLVHEGRKDLSSEKQLFARPLKDLQAAGLDPALPMDLATVVRQVRPGILLGLSGQPGNFTEAIVRSMASAVERPIIFPLSNPTSKCEATPMQLMQWTDGKALVATGSPFEPVDWKGKKIPIGQCNNAFVFPGVGLGLTVTKARRVPNELFLIAAKCLSEYDVRLPGFEDSLFPNLENVRALSESIAIAVGREILRKNLSGEPFPPEELPQRVRDAMWEPTYPVLRQTC